MPKERIEERIAEIALAMTGAELKGDCPLKESGLDSLSLVTVITGIEETFGFFFSDDDLDPERLITLNDLVTLTEKYL